MENKAVKILAIDDNKDNLTILKALIMESFPEAIVLTAFTGQKGLEIAKKEDPDVVLLDIIMPGMDGYETCRNLKADKKLYDIPVVFVTAIKSDKASRITALESGAEAFLTKPIDESELTAQIRAMLKIREANIEKKNDKERLAILLEEKTRELVKSEAKYRQIAENVTDVIWMADLDMRTTYVSPSVKKMLDESPEAHMRKTVEEKLTPDSLKIIHQVYLEELEIEKDLKSDKNRSRIIEVEHYRADGSVIWISMHSSFLRDENGKVIGFQGVSRDITERKRIEEQLRQKNQDLLESQRIAHLGTWRLDLATDQVVWSEELYKMYGFDPTLPLPPYTEHMKLFTPESWHRLSTSLEYTRTSGIPYELELETVTKEGSNGWMWVRGEVTRDSKGSINSLWGAAQDITESKMLEFEIKQSEEKFQLLFNKAPLGYQSLDTEGCFIEVNHQWLDTLGYSKGEVIGKWFGDFLCPEFVDGFRQRFPIFKSQGYIHSEFEMMCKDGQRLIIAFEGKVGYGADGTFKQTHCILQDITKQRKAEKALIESEERYKCLFEYSGAAIGYYTTEGIVISYNKRALENIGGKPEDYIGKSIKVIFPEKEAEKYYARIEKATTSDQPQDYEDYIVLNSGPKWFASTFSRVVNSPGEVIGVQIASFDITERKRAEEALSESQAILKAAFENSQAGIAIADAPDGRLRYVNNAGLLIRDKAEKELIKGIDVHNYVDSWSMFHFDGTPLAEDEVPLTRAILYGETCSDEFIIRRDSFEDRYVLANAVPIKDSNNTIKAGMVVFIDVTEKRRAEESIRKQNDLFASLLKLLPVGVFMVDAAEGKPLVVNEMGKDLLGSGILPDANEHNLSEVYQAYKGDTQKHYPSAEMPITLGMKGISAHIEDMVIERPDGTRVLLEVFGTPVNDKNGEPWASLVTFMDITNRMKTECELRRLAAQNQRILDNLQDSYFQADISGNFVIVNPLAVHMFGYSSASELIGQPAVILYADPDDRKRLFEELKEKQAITDFVIRGLRKDGTKFWVSMNIQFIKDEPDNIIGTEGLVRDITERKQTESELLRFAEELEQQRNALEKRLVQSVNAISKIGELRDVYTAGHQRRVEALSCAIGRDMGLVAEQIHSLSYGALVHDIGKFFIPSEILNKPGKITALEYRILQTHVEESYNVVKEIDFPEEIHTMIYQHHERLDGSGYPQGLSGDKIILQSRILAVADVVEAMTSHRPYRAALGIDAALEEILLHRGTKYDAEVVDICVKLFRENGYAL